MTILCPQGVVDIVSVLDVPGTNIAGLDGDELVFADRTVTSVGQIIALVLARDQPSAQRGVRSVVVTYTDLPAVITIEVCRRERERGREREREREGEGKREREREGERERERGEYTCIYTCIIATIFVCLMHHRMLGGRTGSTHWYGP